jgi:hypothetical protein
MSKFETWQIILALTAMFMGPAIGSFFGLQSQIIFDWLKDRRGKTPGQIAKGNGNLDGGAGAIRSATKHFQEQTGVRHDVLFLRDQCQINASNINKLMADQKQYHVESQEVFVNILEELRRMNSHLERSQIV